MLVSAALSSNDLKTLYFFPLSEFLCKFLMAAQNFPIFMSSFCIGAIACDRFRFIVQPTRKQMTAKQVSESPTCTYLPHRLFFVARE